MKPERDLLCKIFKVSRTDLVDISPERTHYHIDAVNRLREIFNDDTVTSVRSQLHEEGFIVRQDEDVTYAINFKQHIIINLTEENFNLDRPRKQFVKQIERQKIPATNKSLLHVSQARASCVMQVVAAIARNVSGKLDRKVVMMMLMMAIQ